MKAIPAIALSLTALLASGAVDNDAEVTSAPGFEVHALAPLLDGGDVVAVRSLTLKEGADAKAFENYVAQVYTPAFEKHAPGVKAYVMRGDRGKDKGGYVLVWVFDSADTRDFYYPREGEDLSEGGTRFFDQLPELNMADYLAPADTTTVNYTDYMVIE